MNNEDLARDHFDSFDYDGPVVASYRVSNSEYFVIARPGHGSGHRLSNTVPYHKVDSKIVEYVHSVGMNFGFADLLIKDFDVFDGEVV